MVRQIGDLQGSIKRRESNVLDRRQAETKMRDVIKRTSKLQGLELGQKEFGPRVNKFISRMPRSVYLIKSYLQQADMSLTVETQTPLEVSLLISKYIEENFAQEITIKAATLDRTNNTYITTMEVVFL